MVLAFLIFLSLSVLLVGGLLAANAALPDYPIYLEEDWREPCKVCAPADEWGLCPICDNPIKEEEKIVN